MAANPGRIVVFGATGYTGRLVSEALVGRGARPCLAARSLSRLSELDRELGGGFDLAEADVERPDSVKALVGSGDVLVSTVGPFLRWGAPAVEAALAAGCSYLDSTGEPPFIRAVFEDHGPRATAAGGALLTAFGYDFVPGNLAGALALRDAGEVATRVDVGYFFGSPPVPPPPTPSGEKLRGVTRLMSGMGGASGGTMASLVGVMPLPSFAWRDGRLVTERAATRLRSFEVGGRSHTGVTVGASENLALPKAFPRLREVNSYLGWFGPLSRAVQVSSLVGSGVSRLPGGAAVLGRAGSRVKGSTGGPGPAERAKTGSMIVATAHDAAGTELARTIVRGVNGYTFTGEILAWGAIRALEGGLQGTGALGPVDGFGLDALEAGCASAGMTRADD